MMVSLCLLQFLIIIAVDKNTLAVIVGQFLDQEGTLVVRELIVSQFYLLVLNVSIVSGGSYDCDAYTLF